MDGGSSGREEQDKANNQVVMAGKELAEAVETAEEVTGKSRR